MSCGLLAFKFIPFTGDLPVRSDTRASVYVHAGEVWRDDDGCCGIDSRGSSRLSFFSSVNIRLYDLFQVQYTFFKLHFLKLNKYLLISIVFLIIFRIFQSFKKKYYVNFHYYLLLISKYREDRKNVRRKITVPTSHFLIINNINFYKN